MKKTTIENGNVVIRTEKTLKPLWVKIDFVLYDDEFARIRKKFNTIFSKCFCCEVDFEVNKQHVSIVAFKSLANVAMCKECASKLITQTDK
ncbi:hypothetical protein VPAG_00028 [Vibrio phage douglas 12A4]|uniref:hypothetical protein n=1 Tax=Vibrio phage douglas 12A4 TaxID=573171 RepID=UPI0002C07967|nr:hypothetical protein VPAG_00028 [Vibrio phage douglas 12A4]AGG58064.1 hypothetical protein VPAG_00028 [Vibrio phage douglas 12A4]